jgi:hypothetical protein
MAASGFAPSGATLWIGSGRETVIKDPLLGKEAREVKMAAINF